MERIEDRIIYSAGDLVDFVACRHLSALEARVAEGLERRPPASAEDQLVWAAGRAHEQAYLESLHAAGKTVVDLVSPPSLEGRRAAAAATLEAMRSGAKVIHNATFFEPDVPKGSWLGIADFLMRVEGRSNFGAWHYEVADTKLARHAKAATLVQLCVYDELLTRAQGVAPQKMHAVLGDGSIATFPCGDFRSYYRRLKERFLSNDFAAPTYPEPVAQCGRCRWFERCDAQRRADDHLSLVAGMRRSQIHKLASSEIAAVAELAVAGDGERPKKMETATFEKLRAQARLQVHLRDTGEMKYDLLPVLKKNDDGTETLALERGFTLLPPPDDGDLYFDMEGDPFAGADGLEYLFGVSYIEGGEPQFRAFWGHDLRGEREAFEAFVDFVFERRRRHPNLHVYHYASYEPDKVKGLAARHATREEEIDTLLRERVLVDLLNVVRQSIRAPFESYSLKQIERFYSSPRDDEIKDAMGSVVMYAHYRETGDRAILDDIETYNRRDCDSTRDLHRWLCDRRVEAEAKFDVALPWRTVGIAERKADEDAAERGGLVERLKAPFAGRDPATPGDRARALVADLLYYHKREAKPEWWAYFERRDRPLEDLLDEPNALAELLVVGSPVPEKKSLVFTFEFAAQEHKLHVSADVDDPTTKGPAGTILAIDDDLGSLRLKRGPSLAGIPLPVALIASGPIPDNHQRIALMRFATAYATDGARGRYRALGDLVRVDPPRVRGHDRGAALDREGTDAKALTGLLRSLDDSYLFVQGPPGSGKTWLGAETIVNLIEAGLRVGVTSKSHKAIHNLLACVERFAVDRGVHFRGLKRTSSGEESIYDSAHGFIAPAPDVAACVDPEIALVAGTAWLFARAEVEASLDVLVIDEAGQVSLADALACGTAARNLLLLGDPMQLAHVSKAVHPGESDRSVLAHLLGERQTVPSDLGIFLSRSYRMHPEICRFCSELAYEGRLESVAGCELQRVELAADSPFTNLDGAGLRYVAVEHDGNVQQSREEAETIADAIESLRGAAVTDRFGLTKALTESGILVVTPYNAQVRTVRQALSRRGLGGVRVGTVDKFQGQEAPVVFFSMASSRGDELPRSIEFLFDRNRLNVAVSRAQALAILVCSPALLDTSCTKTEQLTMVNMLCRFVEEATHVSVVSGGADALDRLVEVG